MEYAKHRKTIESVINTAKNLQATGFKDDAINLLITLIEHDETVIRTLTGDWNQ